MNNSIHIQNIDFTKQTIESVHFNGNELMDIKMTYDNGSFNISFQKKTETIENIVINPILDITTEPVNEPEPKPQPKPKPQPVEGGQNPPQNSITLAEYKKILYDKIEKKNTADSYFTTMKLVYDHFKNDNLVKLLNDNEKEVIEFLKSKYNNPSTLKVKMSSILKAYTLLGIQSLLLKKEIEKLLTDVSLKIDKDKMMGVNKESVEEARDILAKFKLYKKELKSKIGNKWDINAQMFCVLYIYLNYGVIRPQELIDCIILDKEIDEKRNYINLTKKQLVINIHKNNFDGRFKIIDLDDELVDVLKLGLNKYLITQKSGKLYESSSGFSKVFYKMFKYNAYDLRKVISSLAIASGDAERIKRLEYIQGHALSTILDHYNKYSKE